MISTADATTAAAVSSALQAAGLPASAINLDVIPSSLVSMGRNLTTDLFTYLMRVALFNDSAAGVAYQNATWPVYLVYPPAAAVPNPFPVPALRPKGDSTSEAYLNASLAALATNVEAFWADSGATLVSTTPGVPLDIDGYVCIAEKTDVRIRTCLPATRVAVRYVVVLPSSPVPMTFFSFFCSVLATTATRHTSLGMRRTSCQTRHRF